MGTKRSDRASGELRAFRDEEWLRLHEEEGKTIADLAEEAGMSVRHLRRSLSQARKDRESRNRDVEARSASAVEAADGSESESAGPRTPSWLELVPLFPIGPFTPTSECPHRGPIPDGSLLCCMVCSASGMDGHPALKRNPETDPRPEPKPRHPRRTNMARREEAEAKPATRRQRRSRVFGANPPAVDADAAADRSR